MPNFVENLGEQKEKTTKYRFGEIFCLKDRKVTLRTDMDALLDELDQAKLDIAKSNPRVAEVEADMIRVRNC